MQSFLQKDHGVFKSPNLEARQSTPFRRKDLRARDENALLLAAVLAAVGLTAFVCEGSGRVLALTRQAESLLESGDFIRISNHRLTAFDDLETRSLIESIQRTSRAGLQGEASESSKLLLCGPKGKNVIVETFVLAQAVVQKSVEPSVIVIVKGHEPSATRLVELLQFLFRLTRSEAEVACRLADGFSPCRIAAERGVVVGTVRVQIRSIYAKLGVRKISELISRLGELR